MSLLTRRTRPAVHRGTRRRLRGRLAAVALSGAAIVAGAGCREEFHRYGARLRAAPVIENWRPGVNYTGSSPTSEDTCRWIVVEDPYTPDWMADVICKVHYGWVEGSLGYREAP